MKVPPLYQMILGTNQSSSELLHLKGDKAMSELLGETIINLFWDEGWEVNGSTELDGLEYMYLYLDEFKLLLGPVWVGADQDWVIDSDDIYIRSTDGNLLARGSDISSEEELIELLGSVLENLR